MSKGQVMVAIYRDDILFRLGTSSCIAIRAHLSEESAPLRAGEDPEALARLDSMEHGTTFCDRFDVVFLT